MNRIKTALFILILLSSALSAQNSIERIEPPNWWSGMEEPELQLMIYGSNAGAAEIEIDNELIDIVNVEPAQNKNYLFVTLDLSGVTGALDFTISFRFPGGSIMQRDYSLFEKRHTITRERRITPADVIYLIMPDRFANGDTTNDEVPGMLEGTDRSKPFGRHGGDLKGIADHLHYLTDLGVTALWLNPVYENNMERYSYHGYSITNYFEVDPRFGGNAAYSDFVEKCHAEGVKVIKDMVFNHCGSNHPWMEELPFEDWVHQFEEFTRSNFNPRIVSDPYRAESDYIKYNHGWFDNTMPDLDQTNPYVARFLTQHSVWWVETFGLDGIRVDTYPYSDKEFMSDWTAALLKEYPGLFIVGENWLGTISHHSYWTRNRLDYDGYDTGLPSSTDFPIFEAVKKAFAEGEDVYRLYETLGADFLYRDPAYNMIFFENHDLSRFYTSAGEKMNMLKLATAFLLTTRGIPQLYYGSEILLEGNKELKGDGDVRNDFPGGWPGDSADAFTEERRTPEQNEIYSYTSRLLNWRKNSKAVTDGDLTHFLTYGNVYVYFRMRGEEKVMIILNGSSDTRKIAAGRFSECIGDYTSGKDVLTEKVHGLSDTLTVPAETALILELR